MCWGALFARRVSDSYLLAIRAFCLVKICTLSMIHVLPCHPRIQHAVHSHAVMDNKRPVHTIRARYRCSGTTTSGFLRERWMPTCVRTSASAWLRHRRWIISSLSPQFSRAPRQEGRSATNTTTACGDGEYRQWPANQMKTAVLTSCSPTYDKRTSVDFSLRCPFLPSQKHHHPLSFDEPTYEG